MLLRGSDAKYPRESGILLHITSLPSEYGIGSLGSAAREFTDFLKACGQTYWQILPICPIGRGNSPYSSVCSFAGEPLLIDIDELISDGLLEAAELSEKKFPERVDYSAVRRFKLPLIKKAARRFDTTCRDFKRFERENAFWLEDFSLFSAIKSVYHGAALSRFEDGLKYRNPSSINEFKEHHRDEITLCEVIQYLFFRQYSRIRDYAENAGIKIIGDIPFYVQYDSADVWSNPTLFKLGRDMTPVQVAGVPPDVFSAEGQLWGNPIYDWEAMRADGYDWWKKRLQYASHLYDVIRIDHFRAFCDYYTIPYGAKNAKAGKWVKGVGTEFWKAAADSFSAEIIAEDLGGDTKAVEELVRDTGFPNMKVLQFAFNTDLSNKFLPRNYDRNCVCYTGTHDNDTTRGYFEKMSKSEIQMFSRTVPADKSGSAVYSLIAAAMRSKAKTVIIPMQDYLQLGSEAGMNTPGTPHGNWEWRLSRDSLTDELAGEIRRLSQGRNK